ncbi:MAG TPA: hypothetical protein VM531_11165 [Sphingomicrobium sp.]|jgi:hypothetical protein|nr:hypothetical protein [Sphingomicrobium sp.]
MPTFTGSIRVKVDTDLINAGDFSSGKDQLRLTLESLFANGTGLGQANNVYSKRRTLTTGASEDLDVSGSLTNLFGTSLVFTKIKAIAIQSLAANTTNLTVSRPANGLPFLSAVGDALVLTPGGIFVFVDPSAAGVAVTGGSADLINVANAAGASASYDVVIVGVV